MIVIAVTPKKSRKNLKLNLRLAMVMNSRLRAVRMVIQARASLEDCA